MPHVILVATAFPPAPEVGALRVAKLAVGLAAHGWEPHVVTVSPDSYTPAKDSSGLRLKGMVYPPAANLDVSYVSAPNPIALLSRARGPERSHADPGSGSADAARGPGRGSDFRAGLTRGITKTFVPDEYAFWVKRAASEGAAMARTVGAAAVVSSFPAAASVVAGTRIARDAGLPHVVDYRDPWDAYGPARDAGFLRSRVEQRVRSQTIASASAVVAVNDEVLELNLAPFETSHLVTGVIPQGWDPEEVNIYAHRVLGGPGARFRIVHGGTVYPGASDVGSFIRALGELASAEPAIRARIQVTFVGQVPPEVAGMARTFGVSDLVEVLPRMPRSDALEMFSSAGALLILRASGDRSFISGKVWDYITSARPILGVVDPRGSIAGLVRDGRLGWVASAGDLNDIKRHLKIALADFSSGAMDEPLDLQHVRSSSVPAIAEDLAAILAGVTID